MKRFKTFTLLELLIVLSLLALLSSFTLIRSGTFDNHKERKDVQRLASQIEQTRNIAISNNCSMGISLGPGNRAYCFRGDYNEPSIVYEHLKTISGKKFGSSESVNIMFSNLGAPDMACSLYMTGKSNQSYKITVEVATGKVNIK